jgi:hypothetical protein
MTKRRIRSGSFPLMNLAEDFAVDYGDVLLMADGYGAARRGEVWPLERLAVNVHATTRVFDRLGSAKSFQLMQRMAALADARWGAMF